MLKMYHFKTLSGVSQTFPTKMSLDVNISEPDEFNCVELHSVLKDVATLKGLEDFNYHVECIGGKGESYIANTFRVIIRDSDDDNNKFTVIVKTLVNTTRQEMFHDLHHREVTVYKELILVYNKLQAENGDKLYLPEYVLSCDEKGKEVLILEDLQHEGWMSDQTLKMYKELEYNQVRLVITGLAKLHALSFILERENPEKFSELREKFDDIIFQDKFLNKSKLRAYFQDSYDASLKLVADNDAKKKLDVIRSKLLNILRDFTKAREHSVFCHGDCWINNMLFKFEENSATGVCFLDFQAVRYSNPATDIIYFLYLCTSPKFRSEYFEQLKHDYYDQLKATLSYNDIDVTSIYPEVEFDNNLEEAIQYGVLIAMIDLKIVVMSTEEDAVLKGAHINHDSVMTKVPGEEELLRMKLNEVIKESQENGAIEKLYDKVKNWKTS